MRLPNRPLDSFRRRRHRLSVLVVGVVGSARGEQVRICAVLTRQRTSGWRPVPRNLELKGLRCKDTLYLSAYHGGECRLDGVAYCSSFFLFSFSSSSTCMAVFCFFSTATVVSVVNCIVELFLVLRGCFSFLL